MSPLVAAAAYAAHMLVLSRKTPVSVAVARDSQRRCRQSVSSESKAAKVDLTNLSGETLRSVHGKDGVDGTLARLVQEPGLVCRSVDATDDTVP